MGFFKQPNGKIYHVESGLLLDKSDLPMTMQYDKSMGKYEYVDSIPTERGKRFIISDFCLDIYISKSRKTTFAKFENFEYIMKGSYKEGKNWKAVDYDFKIGSAYLFHFEVNSDYYNNLNLLKMRRLAI